MSKSECCYKAGVKAGQVILLIVKTTFILNTKHTAKNVNKTIFYAKLLLYELEPAMQRT